MTRELFEARCRELLDAVDETVSRMGDRGKSVRVPTLGGSRMAKVVEAYMAVVYPHLRCEIEELDGVADESSTEEETEMCDQTEESSGDTMTADSAQSTMSQAVRELRKAILRQHRGMKGVLKALSKVELLASLEDNRHEREFLEMELAYLQRREKARNAGRNAFRDAVAQERESVNRELDSLPDSLSDEGGVP